MDAYLDYYLANVYFMNDDWYTALPYLLMIIFYMP